jgi:hypothetical protein
MSGSGTWEEKTVVIFIAGGAWIIGHRMWGALVGRSLVPFGILVVVPDYRNFPITDISGMVDDVDASIQWTFDHAGEYGGDANRIVLVGQSAGAHIGGVVVASKVLDWLTVERRKIVGIERDGRGRWDKGDENCDDVVRDDSTSHLLASSYSPYQLRGFVSTSCPHNLVAMRRVFHRHGLSEGVQRSIFGGRPDDGRNDRHYDDVFVRWSPYHMVMRCKVEYDSLSRASDVRRAKGLAALKDIFPNLCIIHGTSDETVSFIVGCFTSDDASIG